MSTQFTPLSITPTRQAKIDDVHLMLSIHAVCTKMQNGVGLFNINHHAEDLYRELLNIIHRKDGWNLRNANEDTKNNSGYDLIDSTKGIIVQVTSERDRSKLQNALDGVPDSAITFFFLCFNILPPPVKLWRKHKFSHGNKISFNVEKNVITLPDITDQCMQLTDDELNEAWQIVSSFVRGTRPTLDTNHPEDVTNWIVQSIKPYQRFCRFSDIDDASQLDRMIQPEVYANWSIMDLSADLVTLRGKHLCNNSLVAKIDELCNICDYFSMLSRITTPADVEKMHSKSNQGRTLILEILDTIAQMNSVTKENAEVMFHKCVNS